MIPEIEALQAKYYLNFTIGKTERMPILTLTLVDKQTKEKVAKYPIWRETKNDYGAYLGKPEKPLARGQQPQQRTPAPPVAYVGMDDEIPFN